MQITAAHRFSLFAFSLFAKEIGNKCQQNQLHLIVRIQSQFLVKSCVCHPLMRTFPGDHYSPENKQFVLVFEA